MRTSLIEQLAAAPAVGQDYRPYTLAPGGGAVAFEWYEGGDWQIYLKELPDGEPRRIGRLDDRCGCPQFSPDGRYLYFSCDDRGSECYDVYRYDLSTGKLVNLLPDTPDLAPLPDPDLSPDGTQLALTVAHDAGYAVAVMPAEPDPGGRSLRRLTEHPYTESSPRWSPDGERLAVTTGTRGQDTAIVVVDVASGASRVVGGSDTFHAGHAAWSPEGSRIAFSGGPGDRPAIGIYELATGSVTWAWRTTTSTPTTRCGRRTGRRCAFLVDVEGETGLLHIDLRDGAVTEYSIGAGNHYAPGFTPDGAALMCVLSRPDAPPDLYRVELDDGDVTALTDSLPEHLRDVPFVSGGPVWFTSWDHLAEVPGILVEPDEPNGAAVVIVHGGPTWHHSNEWDPLRQAFVAAGFTVLHPNYRGSDGYGRRWQLANRWLMGEGEVLDVAAAHEFLVHLGLRPGPDRDHGAQLGRLPHGGRPDAVPRPLGGRRRRRALLRLHRQPARPGHPRGPALVGPREHGGHRAGQGEARALLAHQPPRARAGAAPAPRRRPRPALPAAADRGGRGGAARARTGVRLRRLPGRGPRDQRARAPHRLRPAHGRVHPRAHRRA